MNEYNKAETDSDTENKLMVTCGYTNRGRGEMGNTVKRYKLLIIK